MDVYNEAWGHNWGFVPITQEEVRFQAKNLKPILDENWAMIAERDGEVVGAALSLPDINQVLARMNGRLLPFGWWRFLTGRAQDRPDSRLRARRQARVPAPGGRRRALRPAPRGGGPGAAEMGRDGLDPRGERADEPRHGGDGRHRDQALSPLRAAAAGAEPVIRRTRRLPRRRGSRLWTRRRGADAEAERNSLPPRERMTPPEEVVLEAQAVEEPAADDGELGGAQPAPRAVAPHGGGGLARRGEDGRDRRGRGPRRRCCHGRRGACRALRRRVAPSAPAAAASAARGAAEHHRQPVVHGGRPHPRQPLDPVRRTRRGPAGACLEVEVRPPWPYRLPAERRGRRRDARPPGGGDAPAARRGRSGGRARCPAPGRDVCCCDPTESGERPEVAIERMRFALGVDDDYRPIYDRFRADRLLGRRFAAVAGTGRGAVPGPGRRSRGRSPSS